MTSREQVSRFIRSSFRSVWSLELLLLLKRERRAWADEEIVAALRASDLIVSHSLAALSDAGLVTIDAAGRSEYRPAGAEAAAMVDEAERLYGQSPDAVRRLILGSSTSGLEAFADAFRLRKD
jgi:DNA-binding transcriptional ArsR family regulator